MTQNPKIYRVDEEHRSLKKISSVTGKIEKIVNAYFLKNKVDLRFTSSKLRTFSEDGVDYFLYVYDSEEIVSDWKEFLPEVLARNESFLQKKLSLLLFAKATFNLYCVVGGSAYQVILPFLDQSFGLDVYSRILNRELDEVASVKSRGITGSRVALNEQFRENFRIIDYIQFGKITQEIHVKLSQEISNTHFEFIQSKSKERIQIFVSKAFKVKKNLDFDSLHEVLKEIEVIWSLVPSDYLDSYKEIKDKNYIENYLHQELITQLFNDVENLQRRITTEHKGFQHDFGNPNDLEKFYEADEYRLKEKTKNGGYSIFKIVYNRNEIYDAILSRAVELFGVNDRFLFMNFVRGAYVSCYQDGKLTVSSSFLFHISTEFSLNGKPIFLVDTKWYELQDSFLSDLKKRTIEVLRTYKAPKNLLPLSWNKSLTRTEGEYNFSYNKMKNYIVLDTLIVDGLELCDLLYYDQNNLYLIHVKYGFQSKMRELTNQITIAARRLKEALGTKDKVLLEKLYSQLIVRDHDIDSLSLQDFKDLFLKKISFVLAFSSHLKSDLLVEENIEKYSSNIAKYSLVQCSSEMRTYYYDLLNYQIVSPTKI